MQVTDVMVAKALDAYSKALSGLIARANDTPATLEGIREAGLRAALTAALAEMWRPIEEAEKPDQRWGQPIIRLWDGVRERHGYWDTNAFAKKPRPYWHYVDSIAVLNDRETQPTHWAPLLPAPPMGK